MANPLDLPEGHRRTTAPAPPDTFPKLLRQHADVRGQQPAMREKDLGIWQSWNWKQVADEVQGFRYSPGIPSGAVPMVVQAIGPVAAQ